MEKTGRLIISMILVVIPGCTSMPYNKVSIYYDEFRNTRERQVIVNLKSEEEESGIDYASITFRQEFPGNGNEGISMAYFVISRSSSSFGIDRTGFIKVNGGNYELRVERPVSELKTASESTVLSTAVSDTTGIRMAQEMDTDTRIWFDEKFVIYLSSELISEIISSDEVVLRFYFGPVPATFLLSRKSLAAVQQVYMEQ